MVPKPLHIYVSGAYPDYKVLHVHKSGGVFSVYTSVSSVSTPGNAYGGGICLQSNFLQIT